MRNLEKFDKNYFIEELKTKEIGKNIIHFENIDSTNIQAKRMIKKDITNGTLIIADQQSNGTGRFKRKWSSPRGGLWFTLILKPRILDTEMPKITIIAGASICNVLKTYNIDAKIKWPNDIYINEKKLCGILTEKKNEYVILGIGININNDLFDESINDIATSLKIEFNREFDMYSILKQILEEFENFYYKFIFSKDLRDVINICKNNSCVLGKKASLLNGHRKETVVCMDISKNGNLIVNDESGKIKEIFCGEISFKEL